MDKNYCCRLRLATLFETLEEILYIPLHSSTFLYPYEIL